MRFHLLALPNAQTTRAYDLCGFTQMTIKFARLLKELGHHVTLYASEENDAPCDELVTVITKEEAEVMLSMTENAQGIPDPTPYQYAHIEAWSPIWQLANSRIIREIGRRKEPRDCIATIGGLSQAPVAKRHPDLLCVEYSIGYQGSFSDHRVFESEAWRHLTYGAQGIVEGRFFDAVIPCFYDPAEFPFRAHKEPFAVYCGRLVRRKGVEIACRAASEAVMPLYVIGHGKEIEPSHGAIVLGALPSAERNDWLSRATAVFTPTTYIEPFNQVAIEAQLCGTPVISTNFGGFTETVEHGKTGFRGNYLGEFVQALKDAPSLDPHYIRQRAVRTYSIDAVKPLYQRYFDRLNLKWSDGWNSLAVSA